jgi:hypothetical protein
MMRLMVTMEKRRHPRVDSVNLSYVCVDESGEVVNQGMGRTLNVSESGILLETHFGISPDQALSLTIAFEEELMDIRGRVAHSKQGGAGRTFETGIEFLDMESPTIEKLRKFIKLFEERGGR